MNEEKYDQIILLIKEVGNQIVALNNEFDLVQAQLKAITEQHRENEKIHQYIQSKVQEHDLDIYILKNEG